MPQIILFVGAPSFAHVQATYDEHRRGLDASTTKSQAFVTAPSSLIHQDSTVSQRSTGDEAPSGAGSNKQNVDDLDAFWLEATVQTPAPEWRILEPQTRELRTGLTQRDWLEYTPLEWAQRSGSRYPVHQNSLTDSAEASNSFDTEFDEELMIEAEDGEEAFLDKSFALHEDDTDSPVTPATSFKNKFSTASVSLTPITESSDYEDSQAPSSPLAARSGSKGQAQARRRSPIKKSAVLLNDLPMALDNLPTASEIVRAHPATLTANLLVGVLAIQPKRTVTIRRTGRLVELLEAVVSDGTVEHGFGLCFWLEASDREDDARQQLQRSPKHDLAEELQDVQVGDVVLITNIALSQWRGRSHGTSLARKTCRTRVSLLWRRSATQSGLGRGETLMGKHVTDADREKWRLRLQAVKAWAEQSIASAVVEQHEEHDDRKSIKRKWLPKDDTPDHR